MQLRRRGFLQGMAGILAAASAPAIVSNPMKIFVPKRDFTYATIDEMEHFNNPHSVAKYQVGLGNVDNRTNEQILVDSMSELRQEAKTEILAGRRYQMIDTRFGFNVYEIPLVPVDADKHVPILVPPERRVLRFS